MELWFGLPLLHVALGLGEVASMCGTEGHAALHAYAVGHCCFSADSKVQYHHENTTKTRIFFLPYLRIQLTCDHGAIGKVVALGEVNNIDLRVQS
jgi:hypothetical protein